MASDRIPPDTRELLEAITAALTLPPAAPRAWEERRILLAHRAQHIRGVLAATASPGIDVCDLAHALRRLEADPMLAVTYPLARDEVTP